MSAAATMPGMAKNKPGDKKKSPEPKSVIYLEVPAAIKALLTDLAQQHNRRLTGECIQVLQEYLEKYNLWPPPAPAKEEK